MTFISHNHRKQGDMDAFKKLALIPNQTTTLESPNDFKAKLDYEFFENFDSEHTKIAYRNDLNQFFRFLIQTFGPLREINELDRSHVIAYRNFLQTCGG